MMMTRCALYQTNTLSWILILLAHWNKSSRIDMSHRPTRTHYPDSEPASLGSFYLMCAQRRRKNYHLQIVSKQRSTAFKTSTLAITQPGWLHLQSNGHKWTILLRNRDIFDELNKVQIWIIVCTGVITPIIVEWRLEEKLFVYQYTMNQH